LKTDHKSCKAIYDYYTYFSNAFYCILQGLTQYEIKFSDEKVLRQNEICNPIEDTKNITKATKLEKLHDFIAIDTETTGLKCGGNDIIEICAIKFLRFRPAEKFHTYLKPRKSIPTSATEINGITDDMVYDAPKFSQIKSSLQEFIGDLPLVAHNAPFDMKFLHVSGLDLENHKDKVYDTLKLSKLKLRDYDGSKFESYKLCDLCDELNISCNTFHNADSDTLACGLLFIEILKAIREVNSIDDF
jgi:exonuclease, DNA polymerase III, epsilon subunit family